MLSICVLTTGLFILTFGISAFVAHSLQLNLYLFSCCASISSGNKVVVAIMIIVIKITSTVIIKDFLLRRSSDSLGILCKY